MVDYERNVSTNIVILDRDGVINEDSPDYIKSPQEWIPIPGSIDSIAQLCRAGYRVVIATNQSGVSRGLFDESMLSKIHHKLCSMVESRGGVISGIFYCPHSPEANCACRKPATGLLTQIEKKMKSSLSGCHLIGDSKRDIQAALAFGCVPVLVRTGNGIATEQLLATDFKTRIDVFDNLADAVCHLYFGGHAN